jgi:DNA-binding NtrC family response regulator
MKRRILLVDDDAAVLLTLKAVLELNQFDVQTAGSAAEAIKKLASGIYEMVITDSRMETDDAGFHVIRAAKQQTYHPATALLTAYPPRNVDWQSNGVQSLLVKPIGTQDLLRQIEALLQPARKNAEPAEPRPLSDKSDPFDRWTHLYRVHEVREKTHQDLRRSCLPLVAKAFTT